MLSRRHAHNPWRNRHTETPQSLRFAPNTECNAGALNTDVVFRTVPGKADGPLKVGAIIQGLSSEGQLDAK